jgi:hypothetical protein
MCEKYFMELNVFMKRIIVVMLLLVSTNLMATSMGNYIDLSHAISKLERINANGPCKKEIINLSRSVISASNQTIAESLMLMMAEAERNKKPIFCVPKNKVSNN